MSTKEKQRAYSKTFRKLHPNYNRDYYWSHREEILAQKKKYTATHSEQKTAYDKIYRDTHRNERDMIARVYRKNNMEKIRAYERNHRITFNNKRISGVIKRPYTGYCELCGRIVGQDTKCVHYHHWDSTDIEKKRMIKGIWICWLCHRICEIFEKDGLARIERYVKLKKMINDNEKTQEKIKPELN